MKIAVIKNSLLFFVFFLLSCNENITKKEISYIVDFQKDSVFYYIDVKNDFQKEKLLVTRQIIVGDSIIGKETEENIWDRLHNYCDELNKEKRKDFNCNYKYLYEIFVEDKNNYTKIIAYQLDMDNMVILRQGITNMQFDNRPKSITNDMQYLRITTLRAEDLNTRSINMFYDEKKEQWKIFSIERIGVDYFNGDKKLEYCIDTMPYSSDDLYHKKLEWFDWSRYENCSNKK